MTRTSVRNPVSSSRDVRPWARRFLAAMSAALLLVWVEHFAVAQAPMLHPELRLPGSISLDAVLLETIRIEGQIQGWTMRKLCIDGQAYWIGFNETNPTGISPAFKDGKAEQCSPREK